MDVTLHSLQVGIEDLDHGIRLESLSIVRLHLRELFLGIRIELFDVCLTRHVDVCSGILANDDLNVVELVNLLVLRRVGSAIDESVGTWRRGAGEITTGFDWERCNLFAPVVETNGAAALRRPGWICYAAVDLACRCNVCGRGSLGDRGQHSNGQQSDPERNRAFHVFLLGSLSEQACSRARSNNRVVYLTHR